MSSVPSGNNKQIYELRASYAEKKDLIKSRLDGFKEVFDKADDRRIFEELAFCILTSAVGPRMGLRGLSAIKDALIHGTEEENSI